MSGVNEIDGATLRIAQTEYLATQAIVDDLRAMATNQTAKTILTIDRESYVLTDNAGVEHRNRHYRRRAAKMGGVR